MSVRKTTLWSLLVIALVAAIWFRARANAKPELPTPKIVMLVRDSGPFWQICANGAEAAAREHGVDLRFEHYEGLDSQVKILTQLNYADYGDHGGIALSPLDAEGQTHLINRIARETNVITYDSDAPLSDRHGHVGTANYAAGQLCAELVQEALPDGGQVAVLISSVTKANLLDRKAGFEVKLLGPADAQTENQNSSKFEIIDYLIDQHRVETTERLIRETLESHPELDCLVAMNAFHGPVLIRVLGEMDRLGKIKLITFDEADETLDGIEANHIHATVVQDPYKFGYEAITMLDSLCRGEPEYLPISGRGSLLVQPEAIRKDNLDDFRNRLHLRRRPKANGRKSQQLS